MRTGRLAEASAGLWGCSQRTRQPELMKYACVCVMQIGWSVGLISHSALQRRVLVLTAQLTHLHTQWCIMLSTKIGCILTKRRS
jgi:hypothetical protein